MVFDVQKNDSVLSNLQVVASLGEVLKRIMVLKHLLSDSGRMDKVFSILKIEGTSVEPYVSLWM